MFARAVISLLFLTTFVSAHYTFPTLIVNGKASGAWVNIRRTNNYQNNGPITDVNSGDFRCYNSQGSATATTADVAAGSQIGIGANQPVFHPGVLNIYMAKAPNGNVASWDGSGTVWFKVHEIGPQVNGGSVSWPSEGASSYTFTIPKNLPSGQYLVRTEHIALHGASGYGGAQFYISCAQINVTGGGNGTPGPLVAIPGVYNGREPGIMVNIYYPAPTNYKQPGPAVWRG